MPKDATLTLKIGTLYEDIVYREKAIEYFDKTIALSKKYNTPANKKAAEQAAIARERNIKILKAAEPK
jgi:hypothetical protein